MVCVRSEEPQERSVVHRLTNDLQRRLAEHARGQTRYTARVGPFDLVYTEACDGRLAARRREKYLKTGVGREFLKSHLSKESED